MAGLFVIEAVDWSVEDVVVGDAELDVLLLAPEVLCPRTLVIPPSPEKPAMHSTHQSLITFRTDPYPDAKKVPVYFCLQKARS